MKRLDLRNILDLVKRKYHINERLSKKTNKRKNKWIQGWTYLDSIISEVYEVKNELRLNNKSRLEDELWDILWVYLNLIHCLKKEWYINQERVISRCDKKYSERVFNLEINKSWNEIKREQKKRW